MNLKIVCLNVQVKMQTNRPVFQQCYTKIRNNKKNQKLQTIKTIKSDLKFIDNCRFMQVSLLTLINNLSDKLHIEIFFNAEVDL